MTEDLRRIERVHVCCRAVVRDRYGVWSAVTEDLCPRGCRIVTPRMLRSGTLLALTLSSDLFPEDLDVLGEVVWATMQHVGVLFREGAIKGGKLSPAAWILRVIEHGRRPDADGSAFEVVPVIQPARPRTIGFITGDRALGRFVPPAAGNDVAARASTGRPSEPRREIFLPFPRRPRRP